MSTERLKINAPGAQASALELFTNIPRFRLLNLNSPVERLDRLRHAIPGAPQLWIKRDDLTGYLGGGNKLRKLEYVMADALSHRATTIVTTGSITSNLARTTALTARRLGFKCELILSGGDPQAARANSRVSELLGVKIHRVPLKPAAHRFMLGDNSEVWIR